LAGKKDIIYPILDLQRSPVPNEILQLAANHPFLEDCNEYLVIKDAYPDAKPQQKISSLEIQNIFNYLETNDAQAIIVKFTK